MKTRNGFVSNSSSSSFVIITTKENHERALKNLHEYVCDVMEKIIKKGKFLDRDIVYVGDMNVQGMDGPYELAEFDETINGKWKTNNEKNEKGKERPLDPKYNEIMGLYESKNTWKKEIMKNPEEVFSWSCG